MLATFSAAGAQSVLASKASAGTSQEFLVKGFGETCMMHADNPAHRET
jgi:hypothetical protein